MDLGLLLVGNIDLTQINNTSKKKKKKNLSQAFAYISLHEYKPVTSVWQDLKQ
jgi:hypothetical protein